MRKIYSLTTLILLNCIFVNMSAAALPSRGKTVREITEGPARQFTSDEELLEFREVLLSAEVVFTAKINSAVVRRMGFGGPPVPMTMITVEDVELIQGDKPKGNAFHYQRPIEELRSLQGNRALIVLGRDQAKKGPLRVLSVIESSKANIAFARGVLHDAQGAQDSPG